MSLQLPLGLTLRDDATFDNYFVGDNQQVFASLQDMVHWRGERFVYLWGEQGVGRSHLLQACCHAIDAMQYSVIYLPLSEYALLETNILDSMEAMNLVCIDDVHAVIGRRDWEEALFHLYNRMAAKGTFLLIAGDVVPTQLPCLMPDLQSRLSQGLVMPLRGLDDAQKLAALQMRAKRRGLVLSDDVGQFLLRRYPRNMGDLFAVLERLDQASLVEQRRLTIPFVKTVLTSNF